jgi:hypothetical protein
MNRLKKGLAFLPTDLKAGNPLNELLHAARSFFSRQKTDIT